MPWGDGGLSAPTSTKSGANSTPPSRGGWGSGGLNGASAAPAKKSGGGGTFGFLGDAAHWVADKASIAGHDISALPGGLAHELNVGVVQPWKNLFTTGHPYSHGAGKKIDALVKQVADSTKYTVDHPAADPFQTLLLALPAAHGAGRVAEKAIGVDRSVPRVLKQGDATVGMPTRSKNGMVAVGQHVYDKTLQSALTKNDAVAANGRVTSRVAAHAAKRVAGQSAEAARPAQAMQRTVADELEHAGKQLRGKLGNHGFKNSKMAQLALDLTSKNVTAREAQLYHMGQIAKGVAPKANLKLAKLYRQMHEQQLLTQDEAGNVAVNAEKFPRLAAVDEKLAAAQTAGDKIVKDYGLMSEAGAKARIDLPGTIVRAGVPETERTRSIYGPEGRGYTNQQVIEKRAPRTAVSRATGPVVGVAKSPIPSSKTFTGEAMAQGKIPANTTRLAAQHLRDLLRYVNTDATRQRWLETGSDVRRSPRDILVRVPGETAKPLPPEAEAMLGKGKLTAAEDMAHQASLREYLNHLVPGMRDEKTRAWEQAHGIGAPAYPGYKWVDQNNLGDLKNAFAGSRGKPGRAFDNLNSLITAQTVYYKIGHVGTRVLTNTATNLTEGSLKHSPFSYLLWKQLSNADRYRAYAAAGQHGFNAMPHEGTGAIAKAATRGANFWAHRFDAPFRFNSIAYQAAKAGYKTPTEFKSFLDKLQNPNGLDPIERVKVENVAKLANRENISYDRLSERERRFIARGLWFYPWVKGSTAFTARAMLEHPFKAAFAGQAMQQGRKQQANALGDLPSYEFGLTPLGHNRVTNLSTFSPFSTAGSLLQLPKFGSAATNLNPAASALLHLATRTNQYGAHSNAPIVDALKSLLSPTPEYQIGAAAAGHRSKMFPSNNPTMEAFLRMLIGPSIPRTVDTSVLNNSAQRERVGR